MRIRPLMPGDVPAALELCRLSGWNQLAEDWEPFLPAAWMAEHGGAAAGTVGLLKYGTAFTWLSMMLVHPEHRRSGIGSQLLATALEAASQHRSVRLDATPAGEPLYRRFGFVPEYELARAVIDTSAGVATPSRARAMTAGDLSSIFARDIEVFGADRSALLWSFHHRAPEYAAIAHNGSKVIGYCFGRPGYRYRQIGPVVAENAAAAQDLVAYCLAAGSGTIAIDVPRHSTEWIAWLEAAGFRVERPFLRMRRGEHDSPGLPVQQFAIAGPEFG
jgi:GNAT superfamily N-acetyltransferase